MKWSILLGVVAACGGGQRAQVANEQERFDCRERLISYTKNVAGYETGVQMDCGEAGPRIKRWRSDPKGQRQEDSRAMTPGEFDKVWAQVDGTGWPNLHDCANGTLEKRDPIYQWDIKDDQNKASFSCQTHEVPYPYYDLTTPLDLAANQGRKQLGDDEPSDVKALDKGKPQ
ncbi:MAG TPA: hypothetical protein VLX92_09620 [Kofleriaceae bacterium]|nr:hypothetical protein [Kofleriaceae bacterium]